MDFLVEHRLHGIYSDWVVEQVENIEGPRDKQEHSFWISLKIQLDKDAFECHEKT